MERIVAASNHDGWLVVELDSGQKIMGKVEAIAGKNFDSQPTIDASGHGLFFDGHPLTLKRIKNKCGVG